jgi:hypothetical protein
MGKAQNPFLEIQQTIGPVNFDIQTASHPVFANLLEHQGNGTFSQGIGHGHTLPQQSEEIKGNPFRISWLLPKPEELEARPGLFYNQDGSFF